jgi:hypothetical protein
MKTPAGMAQFRKKHETQIPESPVVSFPPMIGELAKIVYRSHSKIVIYYRPGEWPYSMTRRWCRSHIDAFEGLLPIVRPQD